MSSVTRFIRQIQPDNTYYSAAVVLAAPATYAYELIPSAGAVGNYPAGYMAAASGALATALTASTYAANSALLRDMGKTIKKNATTALLMFEKLARDPRFPPALLADLSTLRATFIGNCGWLGIRLAEDPAWARACLMTAFRSQPSQLLRVRPMAALLFSLLPLSVIRTFNRAMRRIRNHKETLAFKAEY